MSEELGFKIRDEKKLEMQKEEEKARQVEVANLQMQMNTNARREAKRGEKERVDSQADCRAGS